MSSHFNIFHISTVTWVTEQISFILVKILQMQWDDVNNPVAYYTFIKWVNNKPKGLSSTSGSCCPACFPFTASIAFLSLPPRFPGSAVLSSLPPEERGGPREGNLQISSINHRPESNVTNILQLEETAVGSEPSISSPHDPPFIGCSSHRFRPAPHSHKYTHGTYTPVHVHMHRYTNRLDRKWEGRDCVVLRDTEMACQ